MEGQGLPVVAMEDTTSLAPPTEEAEGSVTYLVYFVHQRLEFRLPELESLARIWGYKIHYNIADYNEDVPFLFVTFPSEAAARQIASRAILIKGFFDVWGSGTTYEELLKNLEECPKEKMQPHLAEEKTFKYVVDCFGKRYTREQQIEVMNRLRVVPFKGKIKMKDPDNLFWIIEDFGHQPKETADRGHQPRRIYFARQIALGNRELIDKFSLKKRGYLGTTSMSSEWSILMATQGKVVPGTFVFDPFAGTGSLLILAAFFGAKTLGADIDPRVLKGDTKLSGQMGVEGACVYKNFEQYGLSHGLVDLVACDMARPPFRAVPALFDAIICDPPYGVRAGARKVGKKEKSIKKAKRLKLDPVDGDGHIPQCVLYDVPEVLRDLFDFSARYLPVGGRLVYWLPTTDHYQESDLPKHPCFEIIANSEHMMTMRLRRRLITMEKIVEYDPAVHGNLPPSAYGKLEAHANVGDYYFRRKDYAGTKSED